MSEDRPSRSSDAAEVPSPLIVQSVSPDQFTQGQPLPPPQSGKIQTVTTNWFEQPVPIKRRASRWATASGAMPTWLLCLSWVLLGVPAIGLSVWSWTQVFLARRTADAVVNQLLLALLLAAIVNLAALLLFSILGRQTARRFARQRHRRSR